ncbi:MULTISPECIES: hypothetical protein [Flavobacterium]|uniref:DUF4347 domain-containing protein n=1 Tax=Flavobacterium anhuiense TaxID=459526 RepID=A0ABY0LLF0_9FLAO|nr:MULTISPECIES: hypothetical protein [Flavobacterium]EJG03511.1 hypothetical protein FF52_00150 [Flavobacterium sp. F52]SCY31990.1 hypothetical protein SAMN02927916_1851 [Flavobacterium anhuiense]
MIIKNHTIELNDTSASEMARFRQIILNIWRQQIEDDRNAAEMEKFLKESPKYIKTINIEDLNDFQSKEVDPDKGKLTGSKNLVIFTAENGIDKNKMNQNSGAYDWIAVQNPDDAQNILKAYYGEKKRFVQNFVWRSHGETGAALLDVNPKIIFSDPNKVKALHYIKELLTDNANVVFTACSIVGESLQPGKRYHEQGRNALNKFSDFFVKGSQRNLFLNYTLSSATDETFNSFNFDVGLHKQNWAGFLWLTREGIKSNFYDVTINSSGGINIQKMKWFMDFSRYKKPLYKY